MHRPRVQHNEVVMRLLRYLKGTCNRGILFRRNQHLNLIAYTDADWAGDRDDQRSTSRYFTLVGGKLVTWKSKKQKVEIDRHFIKEKLEKGIISLPFIRSKDQLADFLIKAVSAEAFNAVLCKLGVCDPTA